jgi:hypothetical protein
MCQGRIGACDELMGAVYSPKDWGTMIAMWNRNSSERKQVTRIMRRFLSCNCLSSLMPFGSDCESSLKHRQSSI